MKKILLAAVAAAMLAACSKNNTYNIEGSFDIPETYQVADTVLTRGPITGYVYLISLDGQPIDSAEIVDEKFTFSGLVDAQQPYFAYLVSEYAAGMFAIEPGKMSAVIGEPVSVSGTPVNDAIVSLMNYVDTLGYCLYDELQSIQSESETEQVDQDQLMSVYGKYSTIVNTYVDSVYRANSDNLIGVYCANVMTVQVQTLEELDHELESFSDYVKQSELIQQHRKYLQDAAK